MARDRWNQIGYARLPSIKAQMVTLVWCCALPAVVGLTLLTDKFFERERQQIQQDTLITARALILAVDRDLNTGIAVAMALSNSPSLDNGDFRAFHQQASHVLRPEFPGFNVVLSNADSVQLLNTARPYGELFPDPGSADRTRQVFETGKPVISNLFTGGVLKRPVVAVHTPVLRNGKVIYCLSVAFMPERLGQVLAEQHLPSERIAVILDSMGVIVARSHEPEKYVGKKGSPVLRARMMDKPEAAVESVTLEGTPVYSMYSRSPATGWTVAIGVPRSVVLSEMLASVQWIFWVVALLMATGFLVAWYYARNIGRSVSALSAAAVDLGANRQVPVIRERQAFREADEAIKTLQAVDVELVRYRHHLENLIDERTAQLQSAMEDAQASNAAKDVFVANMSHELRTPMNAVLGMAHLLGTTALSQEQSRYLEMIRASGLSLLGILNDILDYSKMQAGKVELHPVRFKLDDVLHALATIMSVSAGDKQLELCIGVEPDVPRALIGDPLRLQQILVNLAGNAIKFTEKGEVSVLVERVARAPLMLRFTVRDTGIGMDEAQLSRLFSPFTQADLSTTRRFGGTGLGLTISKGLVELLGGVVHVHSTPEHGSEFHFTLPLKAADDVEAARPSRQLHLLVVDDNPTSRNFIGKTIRAWNWTNDSAASGEDALACLRGGKHYDLILLDWNMPGMNGMETMRAIQQMREQLPDFHAPVICMVNAFERGKLMREMASSSSAGLLTKPLTSSSLFDAVQTALAQREVAEDGALPAPPPRVMADVRVLLVEDNPINQKVASGILELAGARVTVAENGQVAVDLLRDGALYDLVLMDVQMPVMDGYTATRTIRGELALTLPVIAMTAGVMESEREQCIAAGMDDFIAKPIDVEHMFATILRHLGAP
jgi:two-component system sensor histidine kinase/response regulator